MKAGWIFCAGIVLVITLVLHSLSYERERMIYKTGSIEEVRQLFMVSCDDIQEAFEKFKRDAEHRIEQILLVAHEKRTYLNTIDPFDQLVSLSDFVLAKSIYGALEMVSPKKEIRDTAHNIQLKMQEFFIDAIALNKDLYMAIKEYVDTNLKHEEITDAERYFLAETIKYFERSGLNLPKEQFEQVKQLKKDIAALSLQFERNVADVTATLDVPESALKGLRQEFISNLRRRDDGRYMLDLSYPTMTHVLENCQIEETRKNLFRLFANRAYPENENVLMNLLEKRNQLAALLGYPDYASLDLDDQMAQTPLRVEQFLDDIQVRAQDKVLKEMKELIADKPQDMSLSKNGRFNPWDLAYVEAKYKKNHFDIDECEVAEYFPLDTTIKGLFDIYQRFFDITVKTVAIKDFWHDDVRCVQVFDNTRMACENPYDSTKESKLLLGTIFLDLHPREGKFTHACSDNIMPAHTTAQGLIHPGVVLVIANFPKATTDRPAVLQRSDVRTFFHEFGHALHSLFGATRIATLSGTSVKTDFVELPSQILEEWLWNKDILKMISSHYKTGEPLSDEMIENIIKLKTIGTGIFVQRQIWLSRLSLEFHRLKQYDALYDVTKKIYSQTITSCDFDPENHMYASFGHLSMYNAKYYGYLWSRVFALDIFSVIKEHGLLDPVIGRKYVDAILTPGGTQDPNVLLRNFLGRDPLTDSFFADMGLDTKQSLADQTVTSVE